ncbi:hypothetical protein [Acinetobacter courvalinii]|uniref:hypothetical protein n=1 Tax=Acinetobacter courvalinii TaxID=280147 RepID=UPI0028A07013|nr:hypothetical protein [Acinetobacter courvalinii]
MNTNLYLMMSIERIMGKYKYFKIKTIQDWEGEYWDVYVEEKTETNIMIYRGWPAGITPKDGGVSPVFSIILSPEIAVFLKAHKIPEVNQKLGLSLSIIGKFKRMLNIQHHVVQRNDQWILEHQAELLEDSFKALNVKYGLNRNQVYQHRKWLAELIEVPFRKKLRKSETTLLQEMWYQENKEKFENLTVQELVEKFGISLFVARKLYNKVRKERGGQTLSEQFHNDKQQKRQWLLDHQQELLRSDKTILDLAQQFDKTSGEILRARMSLRKILDIPKVKTQKEVWLESHQKDLLNPELSNDQLVTRLGISREQIFRKKTELRQRLGLPKRNDQIQRWRLENQTILLDLNLSIAEIAQRLNRSEKYIIRNRMILRRFLNIKVKDQKIEWVKQHQQDLEQLSIQEIQEKYQLGRYTAQSYKKLLMGMKQKETSSELI